MSLQKAGWALNQRVLALIISLLFFSCASILRSNKQLNLPDKSVVLTFDDGPNATFATTEKLLAVLKKHSVKAHFCLIGQNMQRYPDIVKKMYLDSHDIVMHGYSDQALVFKSESDITGEINRWRHVFDSIIKPDTVMIRYFRPAYGFYPWSLDRLLKESNLQLMPISFYTFDAEQKPSNSQKATVEMLQAIRKNRGGIIVFHDGKDSYQKLDAALLKNQQSPYNRSWIPTAIDSILTILKREGYSIVL